MAGSSFQELRREFVKRYKTHPRLKNKIWKYFGFLVDNNGDTMATSEEAICELCDEWIRCSNNATNLLTHLKHHHLTEYDEIVLEMRKVESESPVQEAQRAPNQELNSKA